jgi:class 3 adenylate cyclase/tetratricopeptide (TPR) repeat protein
MARACERCGTGLGPKAKFCAECGESTSGAKKPTTNEKPQRSPRDYTPRHLADKILQNKSALEGERKRVTVLFADIKGSLGLAESLDPEEWHRVLDRFFQIMTEGVHRFEGTVNQYTGDGIMALFGAPISHEDHAQRACYAALHLLEAVQRSAREVKREHGKSFEVRMGIHSGDVVVGKIGDDLRMDYTAQGHTVGLAARMEDLAEPNTCFVTGDTANLATGYLDFEDLGPFPVKGVSEPVPVFQLKGLGQVRTRFDVSVARGLTRFVGRDDDMSTLVSAHEAAMAGNGQVVGIVAEAGTGKSRLCFEFLERCRAQGFTVLEGRAVAHGKNIPFLPVLQILRAYYGIGDEDSAQTAREKIAGRLLLLDEEFRNVLPVMFDFLGVPDPERPAQSTDPDARQRQLFAVLRKVVQQAEPQRRTVALLEDLHWFDPASEAFVEQWVDAVAGTSAFLVVNFRPEYRAAWMRKSYYRQLPLTPLGAAAIRDLLDDLLGTDASIAGLAEAIHTRTGGNPFFTEEVVQSLIEAGNLEGTKGRYRLVSPADQLDVPNTVQAILASRIDRLAEREKHALQAAAVIGKEFSQPVLEAACEATPAEILESLAALKTAEFVYEQAIYPVAEYAFKHPLTQEVAYGSQLRARRRKVHARVARALEGLHADSLDEQSALLAHHWEQAGEHWQAAGMHARSARWSGTRDPGAAYHHWTRVCEVLEAVPDSPERLALELEARVNVCIFLPRLQAPDDRMDAAVASARALADRLDQPVALAVVLASSALVQAIRGEVERAVAEVDEARALVEHAGDPATRLQVESQRLVALIVSGRYREVTETLDRIEPYMPDPQQAFRDFPEQGRLRLLQSRGGVLYNRGHLQDAVHYLEAALELGAKLELAESVGGAHQLLCFTHRIIGDREVALRHGQQGFDVAQRSGNNFALGPSYSCLASALIDVGASLEAIEIMEAGLSHFASWGEPVFHGLQRVTLARAQAETGMHAQAVANGREALAAARRRNATGSLVYVTSTLAGILLICEGKTAAEETGRLLDEATNHAREIDQRAYLPEVLRRRVDLERMLGNVEAAEVALREAHQISVEIGATLRAERLAQELSA